MKATEIFHQKLVLIHSSGKRIAIFEIIIWKISKSTHHPEGIKYRAWLSESGKTIFGFDNHKPKGHHMHRGDDEMFYEFKGVEELKREVIRLIKEEGFIYED